MRFSLAGILWFVAWIALGIAALRTANDFWVSVTFLLTVGMLCASVLGAVLERGKGGVWWLGFALFGWVYFVLGLIPGTAELAYLPSKSLVRWAFQVSNTQPWPMAANRSLSILIGPDGRPTSSIEIPVIRIGHCLFLLVFARVGAMVSCLFTRGLPWKHQKPDDSRQTPPIEITPTFR